MRRIFWRMALAFVVLGAGVCSSYSQDVKLDAKLIWGTINPQSSDAFIKAEAPLDQKLRGIFKWKNYYEINRQVTNIAVNASAKVVMSKKCEILVKNQGKSHVEVKLFGSGKLLTRTVEDLPNDDWIILAGECENMSAWFVVLKKSSVTAASIR